MNATEMSLAGSNNTSEGVADAPCAGLGLTCPNLWKPIHLVEILATIFRLPIASLVIYVSIVKSKWESFTLYTLNVFSVCLVCDCFSMFTTAWAISRLYNANVPMFVQESFLGGTVLAVNLSSAITFRLFTLYFSIISLLALDAPVFYKEHLSDRRWRFYLPMHVFGFAGGAVSTWALIRTETDITQKIPLHCYNTTITVLSGAIISVTAKAACVVRAYSKDGFTSQERCRRRRRLYSFLVYSLPLNFISLPVAVYCIANICDFNFDFLEVLNDIMSYCEMTLRTLIIGVCTLIAIPNYRRALRALVGCKGQANSSSSRFSSS